MSATILIAAGGSGGHVVPALAVANELKKLRPDARIVFVGAGRELEAKLLDPSGFERRTIAFAPFLGGGIRGKLKLLAAFPGALVSGLSLLRELKPDAAIGFGGYPSFIPILAAFLKRIPRILHGQDVQAGLANRALSMISSRTFTPPHPRGFPKWVKVEPIGMIVREQFTKIPEYRAPSVSTCCRILVLGGSQGAASVNTAVLNMIPLLKERNVSVRHQTGKQDFERVSAAYRNSGFQGASVEMFIDDVPSALAESHLVITRAGAGGTGEIIAAGRPAIFVPLNLAASHQRVNVEALSDVGGAVIVDQVEGFDKKLLEVVDDFLKNPEKLERVAKNAKAFGAQSGGKSVALQVAEAVLESIK